ncbi:hypothetical protein ACFP81_01615 [Deinococcus lacus]|uniref:Uncharacterized protein n=1 Tax=Deinococcus lacus TaxID=392561 RepID=A0ABW1YBK8_9DEIO
MTVHFSDQPGRIHFGSLQALTPQARALAALGEAVPALEKQLGFALAVTAEAKPDGFLWIEAVLPDQHCTLENKAVVGQTLRDAARPFTELVYIEMDSDAPYAQ